MLEEICEKVEVAEQTDEKEKKKIRLKKSRKSIGDAVSYLQETSNQEMALSREEIDLRFPSCHNRRFKCKRKCFR